MYGDSDATSYCMPLVHMDSNDNLSSPRLESTSECSSVSDRELVSDPPSEEASPFRRHPKEIVLLDN